MNKYENTYNIFSVFIITILLLMFTLAYGFNIDDQTIRQAQTETKHIPKLPKPKSHKKLTADEIWGKYFEIYVQSDPDSPQPGFGLYNGLISTCSYIAYTKTPRIIDGMDELYRNLEYPELLERAGIGGRIPLMVYIETDSTANSATVMGYPKKCRFYDLEKAACDVIRKIKFEPAMQNDKVLAARLWITIEFIPNATIDTLYQNESTHDGPFFELPVEPPYPLLSGSWENLWKKAIKKAGKDVNGYTVIRTYIDENGNVLRTKSLRPSTKYPARDEAAISVIRNTKFKPAMLRGKIPVGVWFNIPVIFKMNK